uniref:THAP-type domain-containing protein n=1 Tax=Strigamia maritima TaxID=126957 RepID=T1IXJ8_STRMM
MAWARNAGRDDFLKKSADELHKNAVLCATHFENSYFYNPKNKKRLHCDAIPNIFKSTSYHTPKPVTSTILTTPPLISVPQPKRKRLTPTPPPPTQSATSPHSKELPNSTASLLKIHSLITRENTKWTRGGRRLAIILYIHFHDRYRALAHQFDLPPVRLLRKWLNDEQFYPGIRTNHLRMLHDSDMFSRCPDKIEKQSAVLIMRRVKLTPGLSYDSKCDRVEGLQDLDWMGRARYVATHAIVLTVKGMFTEWRLPVGYFPVCDGRMSIPLVAKLLIEALVELESTGLQVRVLVMAYTAHTQQLMEYFAVSLTRPFICFMGHRILVVYDPPSLLKRLFYSFKKSDIHFGEKNVASWRQVEKFYAVDTAQKYPISPEITMKHMEVARYGDVTTKMATQIFHSRTAASISYGNYLGDKHEDATSTAIFLRTIAELYGYFSGNLPDDVNPKQLTQLLAKMKNLYYTEGKEPKACLRAWHLSISSLSQLNQFCLDPKVQPRRKINMNMKILRLKDPQLTRLRINQVDRGGGGDTANSVRQSIRELSISALMKPKKLKCLKLEPLYFPKVVQRLSTQTHVVENKKISANKRIGNGPREFPRENGLSMVAGLIVRSVLERHSCSVCDRHWVRMCSLPNGVTELFVMWLEQIDGFLFKANEVAVPTERLMELVFRLEDYFSVVFSKIVHMDRAALRLGKALRRRFREDLVDMCAPMRKAFLAMFVRYEIKRCLAVHNSRRLLGPTLNARWKKRLVSIFVGIYFMHFFHPFYPACLINSFYPAPWLNSQFTGMQLFPG